MWKFFLDWVIWLISSQHYLLPSFHFQFLCICVGEFFCRQKIDGSFLSIQYDNVCFSFMSLIHLCSGLISTGSDLVLSFYDLFLFEKSINKEIMRDRGGLPNDHSVQIELIWSWKTETSCRTHTWLRVPWIWVPFYFFSRP